MPNEKCGTKRTAGVARRRLNPNVRKRSLSQQSPVRDAVERDATGHHEILQTRLAMDRLSERQNDIFRDGLNAGREIHMMLLDAVIRLSRRSTEEIVEASVRHRQALAVVEVRHVQPQTAVWLDVNKMSIDEVAINGSPVRRKSHQLVLTAIDFEAAVVRERRVEQA